MTPERVNAMLRRMSTDVRHIASATLRSLVFIAIAILLILVLLPAVAVAART